MSWQQADRRLQSPVTLSVVEVNLVPNIEVLGVTANERLTVASSSERNYSARKHESFFNTARFIFYGGQRLLHSVQITNASNIGILPGGMEHLLEPKTELALSNAAP